MDGYTDCIDRLLKAVAIKSSDRRRAVIFAKNKPEVIK